MPELTLPQHLRLPAVAVAWVLLLGVATSLPGQTPPPEETPEAREPARLCERLDEEEGIEACRAALALGLGPERRGPCARSWPGTSSTSSGGASSPSSTGKTSA